MIDIKVPTVGESISEVTLLKWVKNSGDYVERDEVIAELESEKATFEVNAEQAGTLTRYLAHLGKRGEVFDFATEFGYPLPVRVLAALLGVPTGDLHWFREQAQALAPALEPTLTAVELDAAVRARSRLGLYFADLVGNRRDAPADDLVTALVSVRDTDGDRLTRDEIVATLVLLVAGGFETTANLLSNGLAVLLVSFALLCGSPVLAQAPPLERCENVCNPCLTHCSTPCLTTDELGHDQEFTCGQMDSPTPTCFTAPL